MVDLQGKMIASQVDFDKSWLIQSDVYNSSRVPDLEEMENDVGPETPCDEGFLGTHHFYNTVRAGNTADGLI